MTGTCTCPTVSERERRIYVPRVRGNTTDAYDVEGFRDRSPRHVGKHYDDLAAFTDPNFPVPFDLQRLLGTIDTLFSQAGPAPALEVGNRLRTLSQILVSLSQASKQATPFVITTVG